MDTKPLPLLSSPQILVEMLCMPSTGCSKGHHLPPTRVLPWVLHSFLLLGAGVILSPFHAGRLSLQKSCPGQSEVDVVDSDLNPGLLKPTGLFGPRLSICPASAESHFVPLQNDSAGLYLCWSFPAQIFMILCEQEVSLLSEQVLSPLLPQVNFVLGSVLVAII